MRESIKYYTGYEITDEVIRKINIIELKRIKEGITYIKPVPIETLKDLCRIHGTFPDEENIILGEDWYIIYSKYDNDSSEIEINEWLAIKNVKNKLVQTMEMFNAMKKILLQNPNAKIYATMRHSTSYKFYKTLLTRNYFEEIFDRPDIDDELSEEQQMIKEELKNKYQSLEEYLQYSEKENKTNQSFDDFIHHYIIFKITDKFVKRYKKIMR